MLSRVQPCWGKDSGKAGCLRRGGQNEDGGMKEAMRSKGRAMEGIDRLQLLHNPIESHDPMFTAPSSGQ